MPAALPSPYRHHFLTAAATRHAAWLTASGLAARTRRTYSQEVHRYLTWLDGRPRLAAVFSGPPPGRGHDASGGAVTARELGDAETRVRQVAADKAATAYHDYLLGRGAAPASVKLALSAAGSFYSALGLRTPLITDRVTTRPYARPRTLTPAERARVLGEAAERGRRDHALAVFADAGLRPGEIVAADLADVTPGAAGVRVRGGPYPHRARVVPFTAPHARAAVAAWCQERTQIRASDPALFLTRRGRRIALRTVEHVIGQAGAAAGLQVSPVTVRNTCAAQLADDGMPPDELAGRLGHARAETLRPFAATGPGSQNDSGPGPESGGPLAGRDGAQIRTAAPARARRDVPGLPGPGAAQHGR